jgi:hypothetical protein
MTIGSEVEKLAHHAVEVQSRSKPGLRPRHRPTGVEDEVVVTVAPHHQIITTQQHHQYTTKEIAAPHDCIGTSPDITTPQTTQVLHHQTEDSQATELISSSKFKPRPSGDPGGAQGRLV